MRSNFRGPCLKQSLEESGEHKRVVDLIWIVGSSCRNNICACLLCVFGVDFWRRIRAREHNGLLCHGSHHGFCQNVSDGKSDEDICSLNCLLEPSSPLGIRESRYFPLVLVHALCSFVKNALFINHRDVFHSVCEQKMDCRNAGCSRSVDHDPNLFRFFLCKRERVDERAYNNDRGSVLVVVKHGNIKLLSQSALDFKAPGSGNVFQVDAGIIGGQGLHDLNDFLRIFFGQ